MMKLFNLQRMIKIMLLSMLLVLVSPTVTNIVYAETDNLSKETATKDPENLNKSFDKMQTIAKQSQKITNPIVVKTMKNNALNFINENKIILNGKNIHLLWNDSNFLSIDQKNENYQSISIPIEGKEYSYFSNLTIVFDKSKNLITYSETLITKNQVNKFVIHTYIEGKKVSTQTTDIDYVNNSILKEGLFSLKQSVEESRNVNARGIGAIAGCIAAIAGINGTVAYLIAGTCVAACPAVAPICAACIAGVCTIGAADIGGVIACFKL
ncbi:hypothetical protein [Enterococcus villorum]|uniref:hypothetical protein n=1 Tax=Enterococcus villorum TaxID=112904 RepID=UPI0009C09890|nr:hypothetical protein [Enterococcus villorum]